MRLAIFGGSGRTGLHLVEQALADGHDLTVLVRDPVKLTRHDPRLKVLAGNVQDGARVAETLHGAEAVLSVLGPARNEPVYEISAGMRPVLAAMPPPGVRRLIVSIGAGVADSNDTPGAFDHLMNFLVQRLARYVYADMLQVDGRVRTSGLDWTIVRMPRLPDGPHASQAKVATWAKAWGRA